MNELSKYLMEQILLTEEELKDFVVVYSGRFQPFHKGHFATYQGLVKKFGKDRVYIGTSNKTDNQKSPFNFKEKKTIMTKMFGVPSNKIVEVKNPYAPTEILKNFDETTTGFITVVGEKDEQRLGGKYFEKYKGKIEFGYKDKGYVYTSPAQTNAVSGTDVRNWLSNGTDDEKRKNFLKAYPKFDETIYKFITLKLGKLGESINEEIKLDVNIGDTVLMGKFKNKKVVVKSIGKDEHGMPTINGKKATTFRIIPKQNLFNETASTAGGEDSQPDGGYLPKGKKRVLGGDDGVNSSDEWFVRGGYTQTDFPKADAIFDKDDEGQFSVKIKSKNNARADFEATTYPYAPTDIDVTKPVEKIKVKKTKPKKKDIVEELISEYSQLLDLLEANDDDNYVHIGYGRYKEKGKEKDQNSPTFQKDDSGKYIQLKGDKPAEKEKPTGQAIQGADMFKHDKSVKQTILSKPKQIVKNKKEILKSKIVNWSEKEKEFFTKGQDKPNSETRRSIGETLRDKAKGARNAIIHGFKHEAHLFKSAAKGVGNFVSGKEVSEEEKKALIDVGKKVVVAGLLGVATGGLSHGVLPFAQHLAVEFVPHIVVETIAMGAGKAALFADTNEDERLLNAFVDKLIDGIETMEIPDDVMEKAIDSYNEKQNVSEMSQSQLNQIEKYAEKQLSPEDIEFTKHFFDRVNDVRNGKEISEPELTGFFKRLSRHKKEFKDFLDKYNQIVVKDKRNDINIPFVKQANQIIAKTVMRKDDFKTSNPTLYLILLKNIM
jgi:Asp-tRNA(Asn)/Glu-tRNA(Gln) amidotransferase C subunit